MTPPGYKSIKGLNESTDETRAVEFIKHIRPNEEIIIPETPLLSSAQNDLELASQRATAVKSTRSHEEKLTSKTSEYWRIRGEIGEEVAATNIHAGIKADPYSSAGTNFPNYDIFGDQEVSQVKILTLKDGEPNYKEYKSIFQELVNPNSEGNRAAANRLLEIKENDPETWQQVSNHLPSSVRDANEPEEMQTALANNFTLRIPQDQADKVQSFLRNDENIGEIASQKIRSIDERYVTAQYQIKAADAVNQRNLEVEEKFGSSLEDRSQESLSVENKPSEKGKLSNKAIELEKPPEVNTLLDNESENQEYRYGY